MSDRIDISNIRSRDLQTQDFSNIKLVDDNDHANEILTSDKGGRFTLDREGRLKVICPPQRRDNAVVRFFKGLFSAAKREEYRELDRMDALSKNVSFNQKAARELMPYLRGGVSGSEANRELTVSYVGHILQNTVAQTPEFTLDTLNTSMRQGRATVNDATRAVQDFHEGLAFKSYCIENGGKLQAADEFARDILQRDVPDFKQIAAGIATKALQDPESLKALLPNASDQIDALHNNLLANYGSTDDAVKTEELARSLSAVTESFMQQLGTAAASGLQKGQEPEVLAGGINSVLTSVVQPDVSASELREQLLGEQGLLAALQNGPAAGTGAPVTIPVDAQRQASMDGIIQDAKTVLNKELTSEQSAKILSYCERNNVSPEKFLELAQFSGEINKIFKAVGKDRDYQNFAAISEQITSLRQLLGAGFDNKFGSVDDFMELGSVAAFYSDLIGEDIQGLANSIAKLQQDVQFLIGHSASKYETLITGHLVDSSSVYKETYGDLNAVLKIGVSYTTVARGLQTGARVENVISQTDSEQSKNYIEGAELWAKACLHHSEVTQLINDIIANSQLREYTDEVSIVVKKVLSRRIHELANGALSNGSEAAADTAVKDLLNFKTDLQSQVDMIVQDLEQRQQAMAEKGKTIFGEVRALSHEEQENWKAGLTASINENIAMQYERHVDQFGVHDALPGDIFRDHALFYTDENGVTTEISGEMIRQKIRASGIPENNRQQYQDVKDLILNTSIRAFLDGISREREVAGAVASLVQQGGFGAELAGLYIGRRDGKPEMTDRTYFPMFVELMGESEMSGKPMLYEQDMQPVHIQRVGNDLIIKSSLNLHIRTMPEKYDLKSFKLEIDTKIELNEPRLENGLPKVTVTDIRRTAIPLGAR